MARTRIPGPLERRHRLAEDGPPERFRAIAQAYLERGRRIDALDFLSKAGAHEEIREIAAAAVEEGDAFLLAAAARALGEEPGAPQWQELAANAARLGKQRYQERAARRAERSEGADAGAAS